MNDKSSEMPAVGLIGVGYWGRNLFRNLHSLGALKAICDSDARLLAHYSSDHHDVQAYAKADDLFANGDLAGVVIATPAVTHGALVRRALEAGRHVFVEKPLCLDVAEARGLRDLATSQNLTLMVGHLMLYHPAFLAIHHMVSQGGLGQLQYIYSNRLNIGKIRREENALWSFAPHDVSMILALTGCLPERIVANGGHYLTPGIADTTLSHMSFPDNLQAHIFVSWMHPFKDQRLVVIGETGMLAFDDVLPPQDKLMLYRHVIDRGDIPPSVNKAEAEPLAFEPSEPLQLECQAFLDCITTGARPPSDADEAIRVLEVINASQEAVNSGQPVYLNGSKDP